MIRNFKDKDVQRLFEGRPVRRFNAIAGQAQKRLQYLHAATALRDLSALRSNRFEKLKGDRQGQYSIRINRQWRLCFRWTAEGAEDVEIADYH